MAAITIIMLFGAAFWLRFLIRRERVQAGTIVITPLVGFSFLYVVLVLYAAIVQSDLDLFGTEPYPLVVATGGLLAFLGGFTAQRQHQEWLGSFVGVRDSSAPPEPEIAYLRSARLLFLLLVAVGILTFSGLPPILQSWQAIFRGEFDQVIALSSVERFRLTKGAWFGESNGGVQILRTVTQLGWPFLVVLSAVWMRRSRRGSRMHRKWRQLFLWSAVIGAVFVGGDFTRAPVLAGIAIVTIGITLHRPLNVRSLAAIGLFAFGLLLILTASSSKGAGVGFQELVGRVEDRVIGNGRDDIATIEFVRNGDLDLRLGEEHINRALSSLPGVRVGTPFAYELAQLMGNRASNTSFATTTYLGIVYLDFGEAGVIAIYFATGLLAALSYRWLFRLPRTPAHIALVGASTWIIANWVMKGPVLSLSSFLVLAGIWFLYSKVSQTGWARYGPGSARIAR